jgi:hypothetical protein
MLLASAIIKEKELEAMLTRRNNIPVRLRPTDFLMADEVDTVYEMADAELCGDERLYKRAMQVIQRSFSSEKSVEGLRELFIPQVNALAKRYRLMAGVPAENLESIAARLAIDWDLALGNDFRRSIESSPSI